jgi:hypothetical protein
MTVIAGDDSVNWIHLNRIGDRVILFPRPLEQVREMIWSMSVRMRFQYLRKKSQRLHDSRLEAKSIMSSHRSVVMYRRIYIYRYYFQYHVPIE